MANLVALYGWIVARPRTDINDEMLIILPPPCAFMIFPASRAQMYGPRRLRSITKSRSSVVDLRNSERRVEPATLKKQTEHTVMWLKRQERPRRLDESVLMVSVQASLVEAGQAHRC